MLPTSYRDNEEHGMSKLFSFFFFFFFFFFFVRKAIYSNAFECSHALFA